MLHIFIEHRHENDHLSMNYASGMQNTTRASDIFHTDSGLLMILLTLLLLKKCLMYIGEINPNHHWCGHIWVTLV
jgi:hypothetical protein